MTTSMPRRMQPITRKVYIFVRDYIHDNRRSPTLREIGNACYISHTSVIRHLDKLEGMGWLEREPNMPRSMRLGDLAPDAD
ncbi:MAG: hypothetical protein CL607_09100 [Anaerolineaceae bacterium]|nr:hypothetical protein [Anaerolineaceae bacterium]